MNELFEQFSDMAKRVLLNAQRIADENGSGVESEHILLALTMTPGTLAFDILSSYGISADQIRLILSLHSIRSLTPDGLSSEVKKILKSALKLAALFHHSEVEPEHLLLAIVSDTSNKASEVLERIGIAPSHIKEEVESEFDQIEEDEIFQVDQEIGPFDAPVYTAKDSSLKTQVQSQALNYFTIDLVEEAQKGKIDPVVGRVEEINRVIQVLSRRLKNNPVLIGDPGVGKTSIVEGLALKILERKAPLNLQNKRILKLDLALLVAGTTYRGQFEERIKKVIEEARSLKNIILFIDELHTMVGAGSAEGSLDAANILKPSLAKGEIRLIGATTTDEYRKYIEKDPALERRLQPVLVEEPSEEETVEILKGLRKQYEDYHRVQISDEAIKEAVMLSKRYIQDRFLPDKAIDLIDEAAAAVNLTQMDSGDSLIALKQKLATIRQIKEQKVREENFEDALRLKQEEVELESKIRKFVLKKVPQNALVEIGKTAIAKVVSSTTGIPFSNLVLDPKNRLQNLDERLKKHIIGQEEAIKAIAAAIKRTSSGIQNPARPIGSFIFLGPTGVGKTELAKSLALEVFGSKESLIRIDMSEFMERHNVSRLIGAPPGYVGYEEGGKLTDAIRKKPYSLVLLDEIEKAHPDVQNILLQILEDGHLTDAKGRKVNFKNTIIIMTSNIGTNVLNKEAAIGFKAGDKNEKEESQKEYEKIKERLNQSLKEYFRPEFLNRVDKIIFFRPLSKEQIKEIVKIMIQELEERLSKGKITLLVDQKALDLLAEKGFDPTFGARPLRRVITDLIEDPLSEGLISGRFKAKDKIKIKGQKDAIVLEK